MTSRGNEVQHGVYSIVPESGVSLDTRLLGQDVVILSLEIPNNLRKAASRSISNHNQLRPISSSRTLLRCRSGHQNPECRQWSRRYGFPPHPIRALKRGKLGDILVSRVIGGLTNGDGLDLNTILDVSDASIVGILVGQDALAAESVYEGRSAYNVQQISKLEVAVIECPVPRRRW